MTLQVKPSEAVELLTTYIKAGLVPMMTGSPGCGKSQIVHKIAEDYNLKLIDLRLSQCDPTDLAGFPTVMGAKADYLPMKHFPIESDPIPAGFSGWLLFLDEATSAPAAIQAAAYKLILDKQVGSHRLHKNVAIVAAGNLETDNAIVHTMSTALQSRLAHMELTVDANEWVQWAQHKGINHKITDYIQFKPGNVYTFKPDHTDKTYACPRTWEFANRVIEAAGEEHPKLMHMLSGVLGEGIAREFSSFCKIYAKLPKPAQLLADPAGVPVPTEPSVLYAMTGTISHNANEQNLSQLMKFIRRLPAEFQVVALRDTVRRNKGLMSHPDIREWIATSAAELF